MNYLIVQIFGRGKPWQINFGEDLPIFTVQILTMSCDIKESKQANTRQSFTLLKTSDDKFTKVYLHQKFMLYGNQIISHC